MVQNIQKNIFLLVFYLIRLKLHKKNEYKTSKMQNFLKICAAECRGLH